MWKMEKGQKIIILASISIIGITAVAIAALSLGAFDEQCKQKAKEILNNLYSIEGGKEEFLRSSSQVLLSNGGQEGLQNLENVLEEIEWEFETDPQKIYEYFLDPPVEKDYKIEWEEPDKEKLMKIMVDRHDFSEERIEKGVTRLLNAKKSGTQSTLAGWVKK